MNPRLAGLLLALAAIPPAYACFIIGWQVVSFAGFAVRLDEDLPAATWGQIGWSAMKMLLIALALFNAWRSASRGAMRNASLAMAVAWIGAMLVAMGLVFPGG